MGGYNVKSTIDGGLLPGDSSQNKFGFNFGGGVDFRASPTVNLGLNGIYHYVTADPTSLNWFGIEGRVTFKLPTSSNK
jgi:opacity protein-like surface antigen